MGCATGMVKYLVFLANLLFALAGLAMIIIGVIYKFNYHEATDVLPKDFGLAPILSIIVGAIVFITAFLGCCGAVKESPCMLTTYSIILLTIFIIQVAIAVYAFLQIKDPDQFRHAIRTNLQRAFDLYDRDEKAKESVDVIQRWFQCCGLDHPSERQFPNGSLPLSCCKPNVQSCRLTDYNIVYDRGCNDAVVNILQGNLQIVAGVTIGIALVEIIGAIFGLCLASSIRNHYRRNIYA